MSSFTRISELFAAIDAKDPVKFCSFLTDDCVFTMGNYPPTIGKDSIHEALIQFFGSIKSLHHSNLESYSDGSSVFVRGSVVYTRHNDTELILEFINHLKIEGSLIKDYRVFIDISQLYS